MRVLANHKLKWELVDKHHIKVCFIGRFDDNHAKMEQDLNAAGLHAVKRTYDKKNKQTCTIYKRATK